jgi:hypothetical protein
VIGRGAATASLGSVALRARARARALARLTTPPPTRCSCAPLLRQGTVGPVVHGAARTDAVLRRHGRLSGVRAPVLPCRPTPRALAAGVLHLKPSIDLTQQTLLLLATRHLLKSRRRRRSVLLEFTNSTPNRSLHPPHRRLHSLSTRPPSLGVRVPRPLQHPHRGRHRHLSSSVTAPSPSSWSVAKRSPSISWDRHTALARWRGTGPRRRAALPTLAPGSSVRVVAAGLKMETSPRAGARPRTCAIPCCE